MAPKGPEPDHVRHLMEDGALQMAVGLEAVHVAEVEEHHPNRRKRVVHANLARPGASEDAGRPVDFLDLDIDQQVVDHPVTGDVLRNVVPREAIIEGGLAQRAPAEVPRDRALPELFGLLEGLALRVGQQRRGHVHDLDVVDRRRRLGCEGCRHRRLVCGGHGRGEPVGRTSGNAEDPFVDHREPGGVSRRLRRDDFAIAARGEGDLDPGGGVAVRIFRPHAGRNPHGERDFRLLPVALDGHEPGGWPGERDGLEVEWIALDAVALHARGQAVDARRGAERPSTGVGTALHVGVHLGVGDRCAPFGREDHRDSGHRRAAGVGDEHFGRHGDRRGHRGFLVGSGDHGDLGRGSERGGGKHRIRTFSHRCDHRLEADSVAQGPGNPSLAGHVGRCRGRSDEAAPVRGCEEHRRARDGIIPCVQDEADQRFVQGCSRAPSLRVAANAFDGGGRLVDRHGGDSADSVQDGPDCASSVRNGRGHTGRVHGQDGRRVGRPGYRPCERVPVLIRDGRREHRRLPQEGERRDPRRYRD